MRDKKVHAGRPEEIDKRPRIALSFRLLISLIERIDRQAVTEMRTRVNMVEVLLTEALNAREKK